MEDNFSLSQNRSVEPERVSLPQVLPNVNLEPLKQKIETMYFSNFLNSMDTLVRSSKTSIDKQNTAVFFDKLLEKMDRLRSSLPEREDQDNRKFMQEYKRQRYSMPIGRGKTKKRKSRK
jgi:hypothetical protein